MTDHATRVIVLDVVGLQPDHVTEATAPNLTGVLEGVNALKPPFPALTVPVQTTLTTGQSPGEHGDVSSGEYDRETDEAAFWERDRADRHRLWETARTAGTTTGALFFQHLIGTDADIAVTPSPIEDEDNNLLEMDCWTNPDDLYETLRAEYGHFPLHRYWGPAADEHSSRWILDAASEAIDRVDPDLLWVYVPHLDYAGLRHGPGEELQAAVSTIDDCLGEFLDVLRASKRWNETVVNVVSEYGFHDVDTPVFPNRALRENGLLAVTDDGKGTAVDVPNSAAFAMVDHQVAHVYVDDRSPAVRRTLESLDGVETVLGKVGQAERNIDHPNTGDFVLVAEPDAWFQYYWWDDPEDAPPYATDMDIHAKPGFDPCELFGGTEGLVSLDPTKVGGSHGRSDVYGVYGLGGPMAPETSADGVVDARAVAPTITELLGITDSIPMSFSHPPVTECE
ncbi:alkaline phosphatase family protein [Halocatena salina]|uniref:Alkaline phosphatase family protein n=1 Tax=Halocatena salina TaxID=2934340 RepID=A0A8U0A8T9_9EURY|nr:nucleotide pyrophosphatase/phosphodiesterase family protein [Halocatena salina]UPM44317.1 alkaline phosphatase family protein [Halocatena salina]